MYIIASHIISEHKKVTYNQKLLMLQSCIATHNFQEFGISNTKLSYSTIKKW